MYSVLGFITFQRLDRYSDMRSHVGQNRAKLDVLASARHVASGAGIDSAAFVEAHQRLQKFYSVLLMDCGVDLEHAVMAGVLRSADAIVVVASAVPDGAVGADAALHWLNEAGYQQLLSRLVVIINRIRPPSSGKDRKQTDKLIATMVEYFGRLVRPEQVFVMPFDAHIATAGVVDLDDLAPRTRRRFLEATAAVATGFAATTDRP
jgi:MinD-like ATPase involved in chromosome partitioning or flagellar assembly